MTPRRLADRMAARHGRLTGDGFIRETFTLPREEARAKAREILQRYPAGGYSTTMTARSNLPCGACRPQINRPDARLCPKSDRHLAAFCPIWER